jgi:hypothetical protein
MKKLFKYYILIYFLSLLIMLFIAIVYGFLFGFHNPIPTKIETILNIYLFGNLFVIFIYYVIVYRKNIIEIIKDILE